MQVSEQIATSIELHSGLVIAVDELLEGYPGVLDDCRRPRPRPGSGWRESILGEWDPGEDVDLDSLVGRVAEWAIRFVAATRQAVQ